MGTDDAPVRPLTRHECLCLLASAHTGRVGFHANALPMLLPEDFTLDQGSIHIRVRAGSQLDAATRCAVVAFQADGIDAVDGGKWSVSVTGMATHLSNPSDLARARELLLAESGDDDEFVRVSLDVVAGRRGLSRASASNRGAGCPGSRRRSCR